MRTLSIVIIVFVAIGLFSCGSEKTTKQEVTTKINKKNFPSTKGKSVYIVLERTGKETRSNKEIVKFIKRRISGSGMKSKIRVKDKLFYVTISNDDIPKSLEKTFSKGAKNVQKYFNNLLENKINITLQLVDSDLMATLPPGVTFNSGGHFGKVIKGAYKSQVKTKSNQALYPTMRKGNRTYMVIYKNSLITGNHILSAEVEQVKGKPWIHIKFTKMGSYRFSRYTRRYIQERLAVLVNGWVLAAPTISEHIPDGETWIAGKMTQKRALELAAYFNASGGAGIRLVKIVYQ